MDKEFIIKNINTKLCISRKNKTSGILKQCTNIKTNNGLCEIHNKKWNCLVFDKPDNITILKYRTFLKNNSIKPLKYKEFINKKKITIQILKKSLTYYKLSIKGKKQELMDRLSEYFNKWELYLKNEDIVIKIQKYYKKYLLNKKNKLRGEGFLNKNKIINKEDFFTLEPIEELEELYFISFTDKDNFIYAFDIRSFKKLVDKKMTNPYNRNPIPEYAKKNLEILIKNINITDKKEIINLSQKQRMNMRIIYIFQLMDELNLYAGGLNINWFMDLTIIQLKNYYKHLEDIWNYRSQISQNIKYNIIGNNILFNMSVYNFYKINNINKCRIIILDEMEKLLINGSDIPNKCLGGLYILTALCNVSHECANSMPWLLM
jgi:hypothetical protein